MIESIISLIVATALLLGSPGPVPLTLAATGSIYGVKKGLPFLFGILTGLMVVIIAAGAGLPILFETYSFAKNIMQIIGGLYICYIAFKIATAAVETNSKSNKTTGIKFIDGFILNLLNPKAYAAFLAVFSQFLLPISSSFMAFLITALICLVVAAIVDFIWLCFGGVLAPVFKKPRQARILRICFAVLMVLAVIWVFFK